MDDRAAAAPSDPMLQFFEYGHLPEHLRTVSAPFGVLAYDLVATLPRNPERTVALRKLLEAKDCAVRSVLMRHPGEPAKQTMLSEGEPKTTLVVFQGFPPLTRLPVYVIRAEDGSITVNESPGANIATGRRRSDG